MSTRLTSADIRDGKIEVDPVTKATTEYKLIKGGYEMKITTPQPNGTKRTEVKTFYDPKPITQEEFEKNKKNPNTKLTHRKIPGGREEIYTTTHPDGTTSTQTQTFYDSQEIVDESDVNEKAPSRKKTTTTNTSQEENTRKMQQKQIQQQNNQMVPSNRQQTSLRKMNSQEHTSQEYNLQQETTVEETRRVTEKTHISGKSITSRKDSIEEGNIKAITSEKKKKKPKGSSTLPPNFVDKPGEKTTVVATKKVPGGTEYHCNTVLESGKTVTSVKTVYEEEDIDMTDEEIKAYKKQLKDAEKHKNITTTTKLKSKSGTKKVIPSENPGDVTTVETIKIEGGTEYHYTTVTAEGIVKKSTKTVYDPVPVDGDGSTDEEEIVEEYEEEIIEPGDKIVKTVQTTHSMMRQEHGMTITEESTSKKGKKTRK